VLVGSTLAWEGKEGESVPANAVVGGRTETGDTLYVVRFRYQDSINIGKVIKPCLSNLIAFVYKFITFTHREEGLPESGGGI
jgi:hypothetical protein